MREPRSVLSSAKLIALCTLVSRVTGMVRDMLIAHAFGLAWIQDAFTFGNQVPNLFRRLFGEGAMSAAFVPTFTRVLEHDGWAAASRLFLHTLSLLIRSLLALTLAIEVFLLLLWWALPADAGGRALQVSLTGIMLPFMVCICVLALLSSLLNCLGSFVPAALSSVVLNLVMIAGVLFLGPLLGGSDPQRQVYGVALSVVLAGVAQLLFIGPALRRHNVPLRWAWDPRDPAVRGLLRTAAPAMLGQGVLLVGTFLDSLLCTLLTHVPGTPGSVHLFGATWTYPLRDGALGALTYAQRLYQLPLGVLVISLATAALPAFTRAAARRDWDAWGSEVRFLLRLAVFEGLLAGAMMIVLAEPVIRLLFEYGHFDAQATRRTVPLLTAYGVGLWAFCAQHIVLRAFYSLGNVQTPLRIALVMLPLNLTLTLGLIATGGMRELAFAVSTAVTSCATVVLGLTLLERQTRIRLASAALLGAVLRMLIAAACTAVAVSAARSMLWQVLPDWLRAWGLDSTGAALAAGQWPIAWRIIDTLGWLSVGVGFFLACAVLLRLSEPRSLLRGGGRGR
jgi:putative peptidoglycan lipid II flippase